MSVHSSESAPPTPLPLACPPLELNGGGGQHSLDGEGAGGPILTTGEKAWHSVYSVVLFLRRYESMLNKGLEAENTMR